MTAAQMTQEERLVHLLRTIKWAEERTDFYRAAFARAGIHAASIKSFADVAQLPFWECAAEEGADAPFFMLALPLSSLLRVSMLRDSLGADWVHCYTQGDVARQVQTAVDMLAAFGVHRASTVLLAGDFGDSRMLDLQYALDAIGAAVLPCTDGDFMQAAHLCTRFMPDTIIVWERDLPALKDSCDLRAHHLVSLGNHVTAGQSARETAEGWGARHTHLFTRAEMGAWIGCSCMKDGGIHLEERLFFAEVIDAAGHSHRGDNACGELVLSMIVAEAMPILRYRTGLHVRLVHGGCGCGDERLRIIEE